jgi:hypothetical protein
VGLPSPWRGIRPRVQTISLPALLLISGRISAYPVCVQLLLRGRVLAVDRPTRHVLGPALNDFPNSSLLSMPYTDCAANARVGAS